ncbi:Ubiquitin carboxyl-terminal hydrolase 4 [Psilocybe cubensis]|uniref:Ubiquitin carboxyl-terminal hydrolase 4 n=2 Tax=Psilocybe cubensis TaxID=181762 RepID=A0ACB8HFA5_PSICU|nr:Ubiquitin carboxyl-terminal hydrolase 4 [Psilocybe cubensis]KAH9486405.1 Ubiquitin carboxyl-terminal hydrolase 4 [Psilocybe cubensis]
MARSKWISFGAQQSLDRAAAKAAAVTTALPLTSSADAKKFGLENFGNTCYANSVLQALYFCTPFRDLLLQDFEALQTQDSSVATPPGTSKPPSTSFAPVRRKPERKASTSGHIADPSGSTSQQVSAYPIPSSSPTLFSALQSLFLNISTNPGDKGTVSPRAFIDKLKELNDIFRSTMHQDAHEFLNYLLNKIVEEIEQEKKQTQATANGDDCSRTPPTVLTAASSSSGTHPQDATLVHKLFEGILTSETRCLTCETVSSRDESFLDLSIDIEQNSSVTACLRQFSASEMLCQRNKFFCDSCCDLQEAEKRMKIKKLPNVLALHLKRFKYQEDVGKYIKLAYRVAFPFELRLFNTVDDIDDADRLYNLFAIVVHIGNGPHHGHYISIIKTAGTWLVFDDDNVYSIPEGDIPKYFGDSNSGSAYVLYYQAEDIDLAGLGLRTPETTLPLEVPAIPLSQSQESPTQYRRSPPLPPGLSTVPISDGDADAVQSPPPIPPPMPIPPTPSAPPPEKPSLTPVVISDPPSTDSSSLPGSLPPVTTSPMASTGFGNKLLNSIRRAPSISTSRGTIGSATSSPVHPGETRRSAADKSPGPSTSTLSFVTPLDISTHELPPPFPPNVLNQSQSPMDTTPIIIPQVNEPKVEQQKVKEREKDNEKEKDKEKEREKQKPPRKWFRRQSVKTVDKSGVDNSPMPDVPSTPVHPQENSHSNWLKHPSSSVNPSSPRPQRQPSENGSSTVYSETSTLYPNSSKLAPTLVPLRRQDRMNGHDEFHPPASTSSSPSSNSFLSQLQPSVTGHTTRPSTSSTTTSGPQEYSSSPVRKLPVTPSDRPRASVERKRSLDLNALSTAGPGSISATFTPSQTAQYKDRPAVPPPRFNSHRANASNGNIFVAEPESFVKGKFRSTEFEGGSASPTGPGFKPATQKSLPPVSLASAVGANNSMSSTNSASSNFKRTTRKLSLTAPMLGFGKRDKDKEKEREKERLRERDRASPNGMNRV